MICSILLPTRGRPERLKECVRSLASCGSTGEFDVLFAVDDDDMESARAASYMSDLLPNFTVFQSPRGRGWHDLNLRYSYLADQSAAQWVWMMNDDCLVSGGDWVSLLKNYPTTGFIIHPEFHRLGKSVYQRDETGAFPIVPNQCWKMFGFETIGDPPDKFLNEICRDRGWRTGFLDGIEISHQRIADDTLPAERL